jgi:uncharacterized protein
MSDGSGSSTGYLTSVDRCPSLDYPNERQESFITRQEEDFAILQGPPGTGKSLALSHAILRAAYDRIDDGSSIRALVVAPSHRAVNAVLKKVDEFKYTLMNEGGCDEFESLRLIRALSRDRGYSVPTRTDVERINYNTEESKVDDLKRDLEGQQQLGNWGTGADSFVIFGTPSGGNRIIKKAFDETIRPTFDLFAVDEASMMTVTDFLMSGSSTKDGAQTLVVGDHRQLSPIQKHGWEREDRRTIRELVPYLSVMDLFRLLSGEDQFGDDEQFDEVDVPTSVEYPIDRLEITYRCDEEVARILRKLVYARDGVRYRSFTEDEPHLRGQRDRLAVEDTGNEAIDTVLDPECPISIIVHQDSESQQSNALEAGIVDALITPIDRTEEEVGIITPHNAQRGRLIDELDDKVGDGAVDTVDRFQGSERDVIILSSTVSDPDYIRREAEFILSPNRLNVALSRMKKKLIVIVSERLIEFIPSQSDDYDNARLWKMLFSEVSSSGDGEAELHGDVTDILQKSVSPMPLNTGMEIFNVR